METVVFPSPAGVGVIADVAVDAERDRNLVRIDAAGLFPEKTARIASRIGMPLLPFERRFVQLVREFRQQQARQDGR